jgi:hypothetical protein
MAWGIVARRTLPLLSNSFLAMLDQPQSRRLSAMPATRPGPGHQQGPARVPRVPSDIAGAESFLSAAFLSTIAGAGLTRQTVG